MQHTSANASDPTTWSVVIPSYNHADDAITCIESLWLAEPRPGEVLLIDDASTEDAVGTISRWARSRNIPSRIVDKSELSNTSAEESNWLTLVTTRVNSGFVGSCNAGLAYVRDKTDAPFVLLLNNDAAIERTFFDELARAVRANPQAGILSGTIYEWDRTTVWYAGAKFNPLRALATHDVNKPASPDPRETGYICGCSMLIARDVLERVGLLAECFAPAYVEDVDYSLQARASGFSLLYVPPAVCYHRVGSSLGRTVQSARTVYAVNRNRAFALRRNYRGWRRAAGAVYLAITKPGRATLELLKGRPRVALAIVRGMVTGLLSKAAFQSGVEVGATRSSAR